jgi:tRNA threonylcarbamoyladenosine biosynthesis protein TsaE
MFFNSDSSDKTIEIAFDFASKLKRGDVVALLGDLGAGKTLFTKGIGSKFGFAASEISSPTFSLLNIYESQKNTFYHFDWYRLENKKDLENIGAIEYLYGDGISIIEWYDPKIMEIENCITVKISWISEFERKIEIT